jgi:hypothetical protein
MPRCVHAQRSSRPRSIPAVTRCFPRSWSRLAPETAGFWSPQPCICRGQSVPSVKRDFLSSPGQSMRPMRRLGTKSSMNGWASPPIGYWAAAKRSCRGARRSSLKEKASVRKARPYLLNAIVQLERWNLAAGRSRRVFPGSGRRSVGSPRGWCLSTRPAPARDGAPRSEPLVGYAPHTGATSVL